MFTTIYLFLGMAAALNSSLHDSVAIGGIIACASVVAVIGSGGTTLALRSMDRAKRAGALVIGLPLFVMVYWLSKKFSVGIFGHQMGGLSWVSLGWFLGLFWGLRGQP